MDFLEALNHNWTIIVFIGGLLFNVGYAYSNFQSQKEKHESLEKDMNKRLTKLEIKDESNDKIISGLRVDLAEIKTILQFLKEKLDH